MITTLERSTNSCISQSEKIKMNCALPKCRIILKAFANFSETLNLEKMLFFAQTY